MAPHAPGNRALLSIERHIRCGRALRHQRRHQPRAAHARGRRRHHRRDGLRRLVSHGHPAVPRGRVRRAHVRTAAAVVRSTHRGGRARATILPGQRRASTSRPAAASSAAEHRYRCLPLRAQETCGCADPASSLALSLPDSGCGPLCSDSSGYWAGIHTAPCEDAIPANHSTFHTYLINVLSASREWPPGTASA